MKKSKIEKVTMAQAFVDWVTGRNDYTTAGFEMEDSLWAKKHPPARAHRLSEQMKKLT